MSTLNVNNINKAGGVDAIVTDGVAVSVPSGNLLYNGAMQVAQRGTSKTGLNDGDTNTFPTADRWAFLYGGTSTAEFTQTVEADAPTGSGFANSLKMEVTTADSTLDNDNGVYIRQRLEGQDLQSIKKGSSSAESLTLSFWVKSDVTGTFVVWAYDADNARQVCASYTVNSADTWEKKTLTFPPDTTGAFDNNNQRSLELSFWLLAGADNTSGTLPTSWEAYTQANRAVGQTNLAATLGNYWQITGVQLEAGEVATPFEHKSYGVELALCQRYFEKSYNVDVAPGTSTTAGVYQQMGSSDGSSNTANAIPFAVTKRDAPTITLYSATGVQGDWLYFRNGATAETTATAPFIGQSMMRVNVNSVGASWAVVGVRGHFVADAEL